MSVFGAAPGRGSMSRAGTQPGRYVMAAAGGYAVLCGVVTLLGWWLNVPRLTSWEGDGIAMMPNAALAAAASGVGLLFLCGRRGRMARGGLAALGLLTGLIGAITLAEHLTGWDAGIDRLLSQHD